MLYFKNIFLCHSVFVSLFLCLSVFLSFIIYLFISIICLLTNSHLSIHLAIIYLSTSITVCCVIVCSYVWNIIVQGLYMFMCMQGDQRLMISVFLWYFFPHFIEIAYLTEIDVLLGDQPESSRQPAVSIILLPELQDYVFPACLAFIQVLGLQTHVLMLGQQAR